jgi:hypothetical protein
MIRLLSSNRASICLGIILICALNSCNETADTAGEGEAGSKVTGDAEYFPDVLSPKGEWIYKVVKKNGDETEEGSMLVKIAGKEIKGDYEYTKQEIRLTFPKADPVFDSEYDRVGELGLYMYRNPTDEEYLRIPFGMKHGERWTVPCCDSMISRDVTIEVNGKTIRDCIKVEMKDNDYVGETVYAKGVGVVYIHWRRESEDIESTISLERHRFKE